MFIIIVSYIHVVIIYNNDENKPVAVHVCISQDFPSAYSPTPHPRRKKNGSG